MLECINETDISVDLSLLERIAEDLSDRGVELSFVTDEVMQELNHAHRGIDRPTDVLSFPVDPFPMAPLGEIVINLDRAKIDANRLGHTLDQEVALLFIHGMLHLLGMDHEIDDGEMRKRERELILEYGLPESLIVRSEG